MPVILPEIHRQEILEVFAERTNVIRLKPNWLTRSYFGFDPSSTLEHLVLPGLILAESTDARLAGYYVPYHVSAAYGAGSSTAVGVLGQLVDLSWGDEAVAPVVHGKLIEAHCYVFGETQASSTTIAGAIKTALAQIVWV